MLISINCMCVCFIGFSGFSAIAGKGDEVWQLSSLYLYLVCVFLAHRLFNRVLLAAAQTNSLRNSPHIANAMGNAWDGPAVIASLRTNRVVGIHNYHVDLIVPASRFSWNRSTERSKRTKRNENYNFSIHLHFFFARNTEKDTPREWMEQAKKSWTLYLLSGRPNPTHWKCANGSWCAPWTAATEHIAWRRRQRKTPFWFFYLHSFFSPHFIVCSFHRRVNSLDVPSR